MYTVLHILTRQNFSSNYLHGPARTEAMHAETASKPPSTYQFNSAHFQSIVRHPKTRANTKSAMVQENPADTKVQAS
jgi:hypothetical protein